MTFLFLASSEAFLKTVNIFLYLHLFVLAAGELLIATGSAVG